MFVAYRASASCGSRSTICAQALIVILAP